MPITPNDLWSLLKETVSEWNSDHATRLGAALAYYTVFSLAPLLVIVLFVIGLLWEGQAETVRLGVVQQMQELAGDEGATLISNMLESTRPGSGGILATVLSVAALIFGATGVFAQLQSALNVIWDVRPTGRGIKGLFLKRLLSFGTILVVGFLLLVSLVVSALLSALDTLFVDLPSVSHALFRLLDSVVSLGIITVLFAFIYRYLPDVRIAWRDVWVGAFITALLFTLGKWGIGLYLGNSSVASTYGAAGALAVLLVWVYYSAQILFFGAELTQVYARRFGSHIRPAEYAVRLVDDAAIEARLAAPVRPTPTPPPRTPSIWKRVLPVALAFFIGRLLGRRG